MRKATILCFLFVTAVAFGQASAKSSPNEPARVDVTARAQAALPGQLSSEIFEDQEFGPKKKLYGVHRLRFLEFHMDKVDVPAETKVALPAPLPTEYFEDPDFRPKKKTYGIHAHRFLEFRMDKVVECAICSAVNQ